ncbi:MAG: hypothetical protein ABI645_10355 [Pseudomonadota bacterium]
MKDWRSPSQKAKARLKDALLACFARSGRFLPLGRAELETVQTYAVNYLAAGTGDTALRKQEQRHLSFREPRPCTETVKDLVYTPHGMAWVAGRLVERYSVRNPSLKEVLSRPSPENCATLDRAVIVEADVPYTYGDWLLGYLGTALGKRNAGAPVLLPLFLATKSYVLRDLQLAGISHVVADRPYRVKEALVLRKRWPYHYWSRQQVELFQKIYAPLRRTPAKGSILYIGRFGHSSEVIARNFPSEEMATLVKRLGGMVVRADTLSPQHAETLADNVETVIADAGSGLLNIMYWKPRNIIELVVDNWWVNVDLFVADACGVKNFALINIDHLSVPQVEATVLACLDTFGCRPPLQE